MAVPRVLMVTGAFVPELSGGGLQCKAIVDALQDQARFLVLTTCTDSSLAREDDVDGTPVYRVYIDVRRAASKAAAAARMAQMLVRLRHRFDLVHLHGFSQKSMLVVPIARILGKKVVLTLHTAGQDEPNAVRDAGWLPYACYRSVDLFVAISPRVAGAYREAGLPASKLWTGSNGIDIIRFSPASPADRDALRRELGLDPRLAWLLFVGFFSRDKAPDVLFEAWRQLRADVRERCGLIYVGATRSRYHEVDASLASSIRSAAAECGASARVLFRGETPAIEQYFRAADVFVFPSRREARGMALVEAMACGLPSVASRLPGATDHVEDGVTGVMVNPGDAKACAAAIERLLDDRAFACALGRAARQAVADRFDIRHTARRMLDAYHHVSGTGPAAVSSPA